MLFLFFLLLGGPGGAPQVKRLSNSISNVKKALLYIISRSSGWSPLLPCFGLLCDCSFLALRGGGATGGRGVPDGTTLHTLYVSSGSFLRPFFSESFFSRNDLIFIFVFVFVFFFCEIDKGILLLLIVALFFWRENLNVWMFFFPA